MANSDLLGIAVGIAIPVWLWALCVAGYWVVTTCSALIWRVLASGWLVLAIVGVTLLLGEFDPLTHTPISFGPAVIAATIACVLLGASSAIGRRARWKRA